MSNKYLILQFLIFQYNSSFYYNMLKQVWWIEFNYDEWIFKYMILFFYDMILYTA